MRIIVLFGGWIFCFVLFCFVTFVFGMEDGGGDDGGDDDGWGEGVGVRGGLMEVVEK